ARRVMPEAFVAKADVSDDTEVEAFFSASGDKLGGLDALINNAGIAVPTGGVEDISPADWRQCVEIGLTGQFLCTHYA
ncbi:SDR family NAD(P)-dependent oxidoreductase, partial [Rhizobium ruizarguesonis]